jgi:hypothetical protein
VIKENEGFSSKGPTGWRTPIEFAAQNGTLKKPGLGPQHWILYRSSIQKNLGRAIPKKRSYQIPIKVESM